MSQEITALEIAMAMMEKFHVQMVIILIVLVKVIVNRALKVNINHFKVSKAAKFVLQVNIQILGVDFVIYVHRVNIGQILPIFIMVANLVKQVNISLTQVRQPAIFALLERLALVEQVYAWIHQNHLLLVQQLHHLIQLLNLHLNHYLRPRYNPLLNHPGFLVSLQLPNHRQSLLQVHL